MNTRVYYPVSYTNPSGHRACDDYSADDRCITYTADDVLAYYHIAANGADSCGRRKIAEAATLWDQKLWAPGLGSFQDRVEVGGSISINIVGIGNGDWTGNCRTVGSVISCYSAPMVDNTIHEFGHIFENNHPLKASSFDPYTDSKGTPIDQCGGDYWCRTSLGFKCDGYASCMEHPYNDPLFAGESRVDGYAKQEQWADLALNWVLGSSGGLNHGFTNDSLGNARRHFMAQQFYWVITGTGATCNDPVGLICASP